MLSRESLLLEILEEWKLIDKEFEGEITLSIKDKGLREIAKHEKALKKKLVMLQSQ